MQRPINGIARATAGFALKQDKPMEKGEGRVFTPRVYPESDRQVFGFRLITDANPITWINAEIYLEVESK